MFNQLSKYNKNLLRFSITLTDNFLACFFNKKTRRGPLLVGWNITDNCNAKCVMCECWRKQTHASISKKEKINIIKDLGKSGVWMLSICGGEPFLEPDLEELLKAAKKSGLLINVTTNGSLILKNLDLIKYLDYITISIDSHIGDIHDKIRGLPGLSNKIIEGIKAISHLKKGPIINIRGIVTKANASDIGEYINYWKDKTDQILFQPIHQSPHIGFKTPQEFLKHNKPKTLIVKNFDSALKKNNLSNHYNKGILDFLFSKEKMRKNFCCYSGYFSLEIDNLGILWNCGEHKYRLGNLTNNPLLKLQLNAKNTLSRLSKKKKCICYHNCAIINIYMSKITKFLNIKNK